MATTERNREAMKKQLKENAVRRQSEVNEMFKRLTMMQKGVEMQTLKLQI